MECGRAVLVLGPNVCAPVQENLANLFFFGGKGKYDADNGLVLSLPVSLIVEAHIIFFTHVHSMNKSLQCLAYKTKVKKGKNKGWPSERTSIMVQWHVLV